MGRYQDQREAILERLRTHEVSRRRAAAELGIGYATLKRLLDAGTQGDAGEAA